MVRRTLQSQLVVLLVTPNIPKLQSKGLTPNALPSLLQEPETNGHPLAKGPMICSRLEISAFPVTWTKRMPLAHGLMKCAFQNACIIYYNYSVIWMWKQWDFNGIFMDYTMGYEWDIFLGFQWVFRWIVNGEEWNLNQSKWDLKESKEVEWPTATLPKRRKAPWPA